LNYLKIQLNPGAAGACKWNQHTLYIGGGVAHNALFCIDEGK